MKKYNGGFGNIGEGYNDIWGLEEVIDFYDNCEMEQYIPFQSDGVGNSLRDAFLELRYAKSSGKNIVVIFENEFNLVK